MKLATIALSFLRSFTWLHPARIEEPAPIDHGRMIAALIAVEGGKWGDQGGAAHMGYTAWSQHCGQFSYQLCRTGGRALPIYRLHLAWISDQLHACGASVTPENIGLSWLFGFEGAKARNFGGSDYGRRCSALYFDPDFNLAANATP